MVTTVTWQLISVVLGTCCLSSGSEDGRVSRRPPCLGKPTCGDKTGRLGQEDKQSPSWVCENQK